MDNRGSRCKKIPTALRPQACTERNRRRRLLARSSDIGHCLGMTKRGAIAFPVLHTTPLVIANQCRSTGVAILNPDNRESWYKGKIPTALRPQACTERNRRRRLLARSSDIGHCLGMTKRGVIAFPVPHTTPLSLRTSSQTGVAILNAPLRIIRKR